MPSLPVACFLFHNPILVHVLCDLPELGAKLTEITKAEYLITEFSSQIYFAYHQKLKDQCLNQFQS